MSAVSPSKPKRSFFISYTGKDRTWAEWLAWVLEEAGYTTCIQAWDFAPGTDWVHAMRQGLQDCERVMAVLSPDYVKSEFASAEWAEAFRRDPLGNARALIPVRIADCDPGPLLNTRVYCDLVGFDEQSAQERLLQVVTAARVKPASRPGFPGHQPIKKAGFPGRVPSRTASSAGESGTSTLQRQPVLAHVQRMIKVSRAPDLLLHTFYGLSPRPITDAPPDFTSVYYFWADAEGSSISVTLEPANPPRGEPRHFAVRFFNAAGTYPANVAFRPGGTSGLDNSSTEPGPNNTGRRYLSFEARCPDPDPTAPRCPRCGQELGPGGPAQPTTANQDLAVVAMAYRVIDRFGTHWMLQRGARIDCVQRAGWTRFSIDLADRAWSVFTSDGNYLYAARVPDLSLIVAVVIDFGSDVGDGEPPGDGRGVVHLRNFRLCTTPLADAG